jgi:hypothetical protein
MMQALNHSSKTLLLCAFCCLYFYTSAQNFYSTNPEYLSSKPEKDNLISDFKLSYPDTSINNLHNFFSRNFLGNIGLPSPNYTLNYGTNNLGFNLYANPYKTNSFNESDIEYFTTKGPYANLTGITGSKKLQIFNLLFTNNFKENLNVTLKFSRYTSQGFYLKQQSYTNNFYLSGNYFSKNKRFGYYAFILNNANKNKENGGIESDSLNQKTLLENKELLPVKITDAVRDNRELKFMINPYLRLNKKHDSVRYFNHFIQLNSSFSKKSFKYSDENIETDKFYSLMYLDTLRTNDSTNIYTVTNNINYTATKSNFCFSIGYKNELNAVWQKADSLFTNHIASTDLFWKIKFKNADSIIKNEKEFTSYLNAQYIFNGANNGNYKVESRNTFVFNKQKNTYVFFNALAEERSADYIYNYWVSNHFTWFNNGYKPQQQIQAKLGFHLNNNFTADIFIQNITNYLFFNNVARPEQYSKTLTNFGFNLNFTHVFFKHMGIGLNYIFQNTSNPTYIRLPQNQGIVKLFYTGNLFKNNLQLQLGSQLQMYQSFYSYNYMPSTQAFYLQENFKTSPYPFLDIYLNARIKPATFFIKVENVLFGFAGTNYAFAPGYYQTDRAFRLGISWSFFD